jgi:cell division protease FtsH
VGEIARRMVGTLGMSEALGPLNYPDGVALEGVARRSYSEDVARKIDAEVLKLVEEAFARARAVLLDSRQALDLVAQALIEEETLSAEELERIAVSATTPVRTRTRARKTHTR